MDSHVSLDHNYNLFSSGLDPHSENKVLKATVSYLKSEIGKFKKKPLLVCEVRKLVGKHAVIRLPNGNYFLVEVLDGLRPQLSPYDPVLVEQHSLTIVDKIEQTSHFDIESFVILEKPSVSWDQVGGLKDPIRDLQEVVELPLTNPQLFSQIGIEPPKGILLHGPTGTGKTLLARAVAHSTNATFIQVTASELNQKFIGDGAKLVKDLFSIAREKSPSIIFIDEIDALASTRIDVGASGEREVQRTFMQLLTELDGFKSLDGVKVIGATNRLEVIDKALLRPGRFDRLIEVPLPDPLSRKNIFSIYTRGMSLSGVDLSLLVPRTEGLCGAEIKGVCTEAGYFALRDGRTVVTQDDFSRAINKFRIISPSEHLTMFG